MEPCILCTNGVYDTLWLCVSLHMRTRAISWVALYLASSIHCVSSGVGDVSGGNDGGGSGSISGIDELCCGGGGSGSISVRAIFTSACPHHSLEDVYASLSSHSSAEDSSMAWAR